MNRNWVDNRLFRIAEDYWEAFEAWGFMVSLDVGTDGIPFLRVTKNG